MQIFEFIIEFKHLTQLENPICLLVFLIFIYQLLVLLKVEIISELEAYDEDYENDTAIQEVLLISDTSIE